MQISQGALQQQQQPVKNPRFRFTEHKSTSNTVECVLQQSLVTQEASVLHVWLASQSHAASLVLHCFRR